MTTEGTNNTPEMEAVPAVAPPQVAAVPSSFTSAPPQHQHQQQHADAIADSKNGILQTLPPSHILEDGRFIYLPPPNAAERSRFFERSIARHGLLESDMNSSDRKAVADDMKEQQREEKETKKAQEQAKKDKTAPKIHPLWIASARLESGMNELNRAINLATLVNMNEFFTYTNVVDPRHANDAAASTTAGSTATTATGDTGGVGGPPIPQPSSSSGASKTNPASAAAAAASLAAAQEQEQSRQVESLFCLKRKRQQFEQASRQLKRHQKRLRAGVYAQRVVDQRLFQLRKLGWKLVLPEHGTRARLHAPRTNEVVAVDVDLYNSGHEGTAGNQNEHNRNTRSYRRKISQAGRMASRVPRFATIELKDDFNVLSYQKTVMKKNKILSSTMSDKGSKQKIRDDDDDNDDEDTDGRKDEHKDDKSDDDVEMGCEDSADDNRGVEHADNDSGRMEHSGENDTDLSKKFTRAEPFAVADPTLGRVQENFDPSKIPMLNLQIEIHKSSTGFVQLARLEPPQTNDSGADDAKKSHFKVSSGNSELDEELLASLQHSLFCANLFESMRSELDTEDEIDESSVFAVGRGRTNKGLQNMAWLASESEKNYVAPPSFLVGDHSRGREQSALSVIHCHDGEVKVQLDSEYTLCIKLVEANADDAFPPNKSSSSMTSNRNRNSGSQSAEQLHVLCRALLLHAQEVQHGYSLEIQRLKRINEKKEMDPKQAISMGLVGGAGSQSERVPPKPSILQSCVSLGSKMLFERRIRHTLMKVDDWVQSVCGEKICIQWSPLSIFDLHSQFSIGFRNVAMDVSISGPSMVVTRIANGATYRKVCFRSEEEFEVYLKLELRRADI